MTPEEIGRRMVRKDNNEIDFKSFNNLGEKVNRRKVERIVQKVKNRKLSKEANKTVAERLYKKLIKSGRTPNLNASFFAQT